MDNKLVSIVRYEKPYESVRKLISYCNGFKKMNFKTSVFIKPNILFWSRTSAFPKWGAITTSRIVEDVIILLKEHGVKDITIGEGIVTFGNNSKIADNAFKSLGYENLRKRFGIKYINIMERPFERVNLGDGVTLRFNKDILHSDYVVDIPVLKSHAQTIVSLGIKNLKGTIDVSSRKKCHSINNKKDLHFHIAKLADKMPPVFTVIDGIYSLERGPSFTGRAKRSNLLIASEDLLSADMVGAKVLGYEPSDVPHLVWAANNQGRPLDLSDVEIVGERIENVASFHDFSVPYVKDKTGEMPAAFAKQGITGLFYRKFDDTMCTYCSAITGQLLMAIRNAWKGEPWGNVEILTGKSMKPLPGMNATILLGQCMYNANKNHPNIKNMIAVKGCPPSPTDAYDALRKAGIEVDPTFITNIENVPDFFIARYKGKTVYDETFFSVEY